MASKSKKKKKGQRGSKASNGPTRVIDVRQAMTQHLHDAAFMRLDQLLGSEAGSTHLALAADVFTLGSKAAQSFAYLPKDPDALLARIDSILERLKINDSSTTGESDRVDAILESAKRLRNIFGGEAIADSDLLSVMADQAIAKPELRERLPNELAEETRLVVEALEHVEAGRDEKALSILKPIGFRSLMAPWRLFIRGLVHFYGDRRDEALEAWKRLPPDRLPHAMARTILGTVDAALPGQTKVDKRNLAGLTKNKQPDLHDARNDLRELFEEALFHEILQKIKVWEKEGWISPTTRNALHDAIYTQLLITSTPDQAGAIYGKLRPPAWDPKLALPLAIGQFFSGDPAAPHAHAQIDRFVESTQNNPNLSDSDRTAIKAVVNANIAFFLGTLVKRFHDELLPDTDGNSDSLKTIQVIGKRYLERMLNAVQACPQWDAPLQHAPFAAIDPILLPQELIYEIHETRLKARGDDLGVLLSAAESYIQTDLQRARPLVQQLIQIAPRDQRTIRLAWRLGTLSFIVAIQNGNTEEAEQHLDMLSSNVPFGQPDGVVELYRAICQLAQAPDTDVESCLVKNDESKVPRYASLLLLEAIAARCGLPAKTRKKLRDARKPLSKSPSLQAVSSACDMVGRMLVNEKLDFPGRSGMKTELITVTKRALTQSRIDAYDIETANTIGVFVVHAQDDVLSRRFLRTTRHHHYDLHIVSLVRAFGVDLELASPILSDVVFADPDAPNSLPAELRPIAQRLYEASEEHYNERMYSDDDDMDFEFLDDDEIPHDAMNSIPPEMLLAYMQNPEMMEAQMRQMMPGKLVDALLEVLAMRVQD
ncbi:hypothetical protein [Rhodopirellula sp. P2]|uniref:hypothetical protein n=1 Tax=Rhodopirellula sp. P2 TaxID=2127060 RepID=UPI002367E871|nr:hypothetical protein [Rhodopirellula sp. P2]WDQ15113.1 hypothetical protein PSR62_15865 [Rhodopirellula sp. P2]